MPRVLQLSVVSAPDHRRRSLTNSPSATECMSSLFVILKFNHAHLKSTVYGRKQASKQANIHTHVRNAVPLVWGSLRLAPIKTENITKLIVGNRLSVFPGQAASSKIELVICSPFNWPECGLAMKSHLAQSVCRHKIAQ